MSMYSDRKDFYEQEKKNEKLAKIGNEIRSLPIYKQQDAMAILKKVGVDVSEAMTQSASNRYDPWW